MIPSVMLFDTHVHFSDSGGDDGSGALIERARRAGVTQMVAVGGSPEANRVAVAVALRFPGEVWAAVGHDRDQASIPCPAREDLRSAMSGLESEIRKAGDEGAEIVALGEIGLDFHYSPETREAQIELFRAQLELARATCLPVIVHSRDAEDETLHELTVHARAWTGPAGRVGVLHCFTGGDAFAGALVALGLHISFSGVVTFLNASRLRDAARRIPRDRLLVETDSPYLAPVPHRGRRNEPAYLPHVAGKLAEVYGCGAAEIAAWTTANAEWLFLGRQKEV